MLAYANRKATTRLVRPLTVRHHSLGNHLNMMSARGLTSRLFALPREIRDEIYAMLLRDEPLTREMAPQKGAVRAIYMSILGCLQPHILRVNKQINREYCQVASENMRLVVRFTLASDEGPLWLPLLSSYDVLPPHAHSRLRSVIVQLSYGIYGPVFPQVCGFEQFIVDIPSLKRLTVDLLLMVELIEAHCPPDIRIPAAREFLADLPKPQTSEMSIETRLEITSSLFVQNPTHRWIDHQEARTLGEMWLHYDNRSIFEAVPNAGGAYTWRGLELEYRGPDISFEQLWQECISNPVISHSPYIT